MKNIKYKLDDDVERVFFDYKNKKRMMAFKHDKGKIIGRDACIYKTKEYIKN